MIAVYVSKDLRHWTTDSPSSFADPVTVNHAQYKRLTAQAWAWLKVNIIGIIDQWATEVTPDELAHRWERWGQLSTLMERINASQASNA